MEGKRSLLSKLLITQEMCMLLWGSDLGWEVSTSSSAI